MTFFKRMSELIEGYTLQITIKKEGDQLIVLMLPKLNVKEDKVQEKIVPLNLKGTPEQLDEAFFATISEGLRQTTELQSNLSAYQDSLASADKAGKSKDKKSTTTTGSKKPAEKKPGLFDKDKNKATKKKEEKPQAKETVDESTGEITKEKIFAMKTDSSIKVSDPGEDINASDEDKVADTDDKVADNEDKAAGDDKMTDNDGFSDDDW